MSRDTLFTMAKDRNDVFRELFRDSKQVKSSCLSESLSFCKLDVKSERYVRFSVLVQAYLFAAGSFFLPRHHCKRFFFPRSLPDLLISLGD